MRNLKTILGDVLIRDSRIMCDRGFGNYKIVSDIEFEGVNSTISIKTNDSELFDSIEDGADVNLVASHLIDQGVNNYINSL